MSNLSKLARKPQEVKISGVKLTIQPLGMSDMDMFEKGSDEMTNEETVKLVKELIKKSVVGSTEEEINNLSMEYMLELQEAIMKINNVDEDKVKEKRKVLEEIKAEQDGQAA